nr:MAG TPA: hypothetical protein [Caudoviricetes sp.]
MCILCGNLILTQWSAIDLILFKNVQLHFTTRENMLTQIYIISLC